MDPDHVVFIMYLFKYIVFQMGKVFFIVFANKRGFLDLFE